MEADPIVVAKLLGDLGCADLETVRDLGRGQLRVSDVGFYILPNGLDALLAANLPEHLVLLLKLLQQFQHNLAELIFPLKTHGSVDDLTAAHIGGVHQAGPAQIIGKGQHKDLNMVVDRLHGGYAVLKDRVTDLSSDLLDGDLAPGKLLRHLHRKLAVKAHIPDKGTVELFLGVQLDGGAALRPEVIIFHGVMQVVEGTEYAGLSILQVTEYDA